MLVIMLAVGVEDPIVAEATGWLLALPLLSLASAAIRCAFWMLLQSLALPFVASSILLAMSGFGDQFAVRTDSTRYGQLRYRCLSPQMQLRSVGLALAAKEMDGAGAVRPAVISETSLMSTSMSGYFVEDPRLARWGSTYAGSIG